MDPDSPQITGESFQDRKSMQNVSVCVCMCMCVYQCVPVCVFVC